MVCVVLFVRGFRKPPLEAGHSHTISLMPVCRLLMNTPVCVQPTERVLVSVTVSLLSKTEMTA